MALIQVGENIIIYPDKWSEITIKKTYWILFVGHDPKIIESFWLVLHSYITVYTMGIQEIGSKYLRYELVTIDDARCV